MAFHYHQRYCKLGFFLPEPGRKHIQIAFFLLFKDLTEHHLPYTPARCTRISRPLRARLQEGPTFAAIRRIAYPTHCSPARGGRGLRPNDRPFTACERTRSYLGTDDPLELSTLLTCQPTDQNMLTMSGLHVCGYLLHAFLAIRGYRQLTHLIVLAERRRHGKQVGP